jgi:hypothetical protein
MANGNYVWYVSYGSNMLYGRFALYLRGGKLKGVNKTYPGCTDKSLPKAGIPYELNYDVYFGQYSSTWGGGVAFLDVSKPGHAYGRAYLISSSQLKEIHAQEGSGKEWYKDLIPLATIDGIAAYTITNKVRRKPNPPTTKYIKVIKKGLLETYPEKSKREIKEYLKKITA